MLTARTNEPERGSYAVNLPSSPFASFRSRVSKPSVNHPYTGASSLVAPKRGAHCRRLSHSATIQGHEARLGHAKAFLSRLASYPCLRSRSIKTARNRAGPPCAFQAWLCPTLDNHV